MKEERDNQEENTEQDSESSSNFLAEIPEAWKRRARAAFGYAFCLTILIVVSCEIAGAIFPDVQWLGTVSRVIRNIGVQMYHYSIGWGMGVIAPCLVWEHVMYLREKHRREREQRAREQAEAIVAQLQARVSALEQEQRAREHEEAVVETVTAELQQRMRALEQEQRAREQAEALIAQLQEEVDALRRELDATNARAQLPRDGDEN